jgi:predicted ATPase
VDSMASPKIKRIRVEGHTSIKNARVDLGPINILVGANGSGKSNFVRALELLGRIADQDLGLYVELAGGASTLVCQPGGTGLEIAVNSEDCAEIPVPHDRAGHLTRHGTFSRQWLQTADRRARSHEHVRTA